MVIADECLFADGGDNPRDVHRLLNLRKQCPLFAAKCYANPR